MLVQDRFVRNRRWFVFGLIAILVASLIAGCAPAAAPGGSSPEAGEAATESGEPRRGGSLTIAMGADIGTMDVQGGIGIISYPLYAVYENLISLSPEMELLPGLAESWEMVDETTYRFVLRQGVTFHSGNPFNAEAVQASIERFQVPDVPGRSYPLLAMIDSVEVEDEYTAVFHLNTPFPSFPLHIAHVISLIVDAKYAEEIGPEAFSETPSGTGPFLLEEWVKNDTMRFVRNPNYWDEGKPYLDEIIFKIIPDEATRIVALEAGEVDVVLGVAPAEVSRLAENPDVVLSGVTGARTVYLGVALDQGPFADLTVRRALAHAVDTDSIVDFVQEGTVEKATTFYAGFIFGSAEGMIDSPIGYDPEQAAALLEEAGWIDEDGDGVREKDGERFSVTLTFPNSVLPAMRQTAEVIQQNLAEVGVEVKLDEREWASFVGDWVAKTLQMYMMGISANTGAPDYVFPNQWVTDGSWNSSHYSNPEVDELFALASQTTDDEQRREMFQQLQQILADDVAAVPLFHMKFYIAKSPKVHNFDDHPLEQFRLAEVWVEE